MKIERAVIREIPLRLREAFESSGGGVQDKRVLLLTLFSEGLEGWGECVALADPSYSDETVYTAWHVLTEFILPTVVGRESADPADFLEPVHWIRGHRMAIASVEMAFWDLTARAEGVSLSKKLGGAQDMVPVGVSVGLKDTDEALLGAITDYLEEGYLRAKIKIKPGRDIEMLSLVRERFPGVALMADANSAYTLADLPRFKDLDGLHLEMIEQPFARDDFLGHANLQREIGTRICLDESISSAQDAVLALELGSCRTINIKPGRVGGFEESRRIHELMRAKGLPVWCGGMLESGIGRAHNLALASLPGFTLPGDISASRRYWEKDIVAPEFEIIDGLMVVPSAPGIGVEIDVGRIEALTVRQATLVA